MASQPNIEAGAAFIRVFLKAENMQKFFNEWGKRASQFGANLSAAGRRAAVSAIVLSIPAIAGLRVFGKFSKEMAFVSTMVEDTEKHMGRFTEEIHKMSVEFGQSTTAMTLGLFNILSAQFDVNDAMLILRVTAQSAVAGYTDAATAGKAMITMLNAYGLSAKDANDVADILFTTMKGGVITYEEVAKGIGLVAASAATAGVTMSEMGATIATSTKAGVESQATFIAFANVLKAFTSPTGAGADFAKKLKEAGFAFDISVKGIKDAGFVKIIDAISKLPTESISKLFPQIRAARGIKGIEALVDGLKSLPIALEKFEDRAGSMLEAFDKMSDSFGFLLDQIKAAGLMILTHFGEAIAENVRDIGRFIVNAAEGVSRWIKENRGLIATYVKITIWIGAISLGLMMVGKILSGIAILSAVISLIWSNWIVALAAVIAGFGVYLKLSKDLKSIMTEINVAAQKSQSESIIANVDNISDTKGKIAELNRALKEQMIEVARYAEAWTEANKAVRGAGLSADDDLKEVVGGELIRAIRLATVQKKAAWEVQLKTRNRIALLEKELKVENKILKAKKLAAEAEDRRLSGIRNFQRGSFAGFFHTRQQLFSSSFSVESKNAEQNMLLGKIETNTKEALRELRGGLKTITT